jgi:hypothetical protein
MGTEPLLVRQVLGRTPHLPLAFRKVNVHSILTEIYYPRLPVDKAIE